MTDLFGTQYAGFILAAYSITFVVILAMILWVTLIHKSRKKALAALEKAGFKRASHD